MCVGLVWFKLSGQRDKIKELGLLCQRIIAEFNTVPNLRERFVGFIDASGYWMDFRTD